MKVISKNISELRVPERNIRRHTDKQLKEYVRSLEMFGQIKPIVIDESGEIIAGNGLYMALQQMGKTSCDCYVLSGLSDKQKKKLMLADNRVYELGVTDMDAFDAIIRDLEGDINVPGWEEDLLSMMNSSVSDIDDVIEAYGTYDADDVKRIDSRKEPVPDKAESTTAKVPEAQPEEQKWIVCPKCGERICL